MAEDRELDEASKASEELFSQHQTDQDHQSDDLDQSLNDSDYDEDLFLRNIQSGSEAAEDRVRERAIEEQESVLSSREQSKTESQENENIHQPNDTQQEAGFLDFQTLEFDNVNRVSNRAEALRTEIKVDADNATNSGTEIPVSQSRNREVLQPEQVESQFEVEQPVNETQAVQSPRR